MTGAWPTPQTGWAWPRHLPESSGNLPTYSFMLATRTNKNEWEQLDSGYVSEIKWNSYPKVVPPRVWTILQQRNERERGFLKSNLSQNPMKTRARTCERESEWEREWKSECEQRTPLSRPLFQGRLVRAPEGNQATIAREPLALVEPKSNGSRVDRPVASAGPRPGPLASSFGQVPSSTVKCFKTLAHDHSRSKRCSN
jgi:hypothetical protein